MAHPSKLGGKDLSLATLIGWFLCVSSLATYSFYNLPDPVPEHDLTRFSEVRARKHIRYLSKDIGPRMVGTAGEDRTIHYLVDHLTNVQSTAIHPFEISVTQGSNQHLFEIIGVPVIKLYHNITNIAVQFTGTKSTRSVIVNTHFDGMVGAHGAADAATPVSIMLDIIRFLAQTPTPLANTIVFLFNGAEESFQDGSHFFITTHPWFMNVTAVVNLEAAGVTGKSVLFQSKSQLMLASYSRVLYPHGTSASDELFSSGILISDTDYKQFMDHGHLLGGLDMAIYQHSYLYHTKLDTEEMIEIGAVQQFGQNSLDIVSYLAWEADLDSISDEDADASAVYFDFLGVYFVQIPHRIARNSEILLIVISIVYLWRTISIPSLLLNVLDTLKIIGLGLFYPIVISLLCLTTEYRLLWFNEPAHASVMYGIPTVYGFLQGHLLGTKKKRGSEHASRKAMLFIYTAILAAMVHFELKSGFVMAVYVANHLLASLVFPASIFYHVSITFVVLVGQPILIGLINTFVPLTGRMGPYIAAEVIIAVLIWLATLLLSMPLIPLMHQASPFWVKRVGRGFILLGCLVWINFVLGVPRNTDLTPKRMVLLHTYDVDVGQSNLHLIKADSAPYPKEAVRAIMTELGSPPVVGKNGQLGMTRNEMFLAHQAIYPLSELTHSMHWNTSHLASRVWPVEGSADVYAPKVRAIRATLHAQNQSRTITIPCMMNAHNHVTVFRFNASVASASVPVLKHPRSGHYFIRQTVGGFGAVPQLGDLDEYPPSSCDFRMTVYGTDPIRIHAASLTRSMGADNYLLANALSKFPNSTDLMLVDAVHRSILV